MELLNSDVNDFDITIQSLEQNDNDLAQARQANGCEARSGIMREREGFGIVPGAQAVLRPGHHVPLLSDSYFYLPASGNWR